MKLDILTAATALAASLIALPASNASAQTATTPTEAELATKLDKLSAELAELKAQLAQIRKQNGGPNLATAATAATAPAASPVATPSAAPLDAQATANAARPEQPATVLSSYGEINLNLPTNDSAQTRADLVRFVLGYQHRFDEKTKVVAELEVEHAVSSADDAGEVAIEQAFVERQLSDQWAGQLGLFLMPVGLLNGNHEPTAYYGVERNFVETAIIPSTWREGGLQFIGSFDSGITLNLGVSTGFDVGKWDAGSIECVDYPLACIHQEMSLARAHDVAAFGRLDWRGVPGLLLGGSIFSGGAGQGQPNVPSSRVTLGEVHARWQPRRWDFQALASWGSISNTAAFNMPIVGNTALVPESFDGWYALAAYKLWTQADYTLTPFVRFEQYNTGRSYADLGRGLTPPSLPTQQVVTVGLDFKIGQGVVIKADYQDFKVNSDLNRVSLGLGWNF
ncbi:MAG: hypothetical protein ABI633_13250 [Burkholderiales bacterium]